MTKKDKILELFDNADWIDSGSGRKLKIITQNDFDSQHLNARLEYGEKNGDIRYAARIMQNLGFKCIIGGFDGLVVIQPTDTNDGEELRK